MFWLSQILSDDDNSFHLELKRWYIELNIHLHNFTLNAESILKNSKGYQSYIHITLTPLPYIKFKAEGWNKFNTLN